MQTLVPRVRVLTFEPSTHRGRRVAIASVEIDPPGIEIRFLRIIERPSDGRLFLTFPYIRVGNADAPGSKRVAAVQISDSETFYEIEAALTASFRAAFPSARQRRHERRMAAAIEPKRAAGK